MSSGRILAEILKEIFDTVTGSDPMHDPLFDSNDNHIKKHHFSKQEKKMMAMERDKLDSNEFKPLNFGHKKQEKNEQDLVTEYNPPKPKPPKDDEIFKPFKFNNSNKVKVPTPNVNTTSSVIKLQILLLNYIFMEDDGKITTIEKILIKKHFKQSKHLLTRYDINEIYHYKNIDKSILNIKAMISANNITKDQINHAIEEIKRTFNLKTNYHTIIKKLESNLLQD